ncbi:MAG: hypothetical protein AMJ53_04925 [Gammaproteobacteria bacterium SG8_11]|nr:MAG: hypothetical protein AMJ53_04925 [Gammaproteobacteria bacterium SG8_11]
MAVIGVQTMNQPKEAAPSLAEMPSTDQYVRMEPIANTASVNPTSPAYVTPNPNVVTPSVPAMKASASDSVPSNARGTQIYQYHPQLNKYLLNHNQYTLSSRVQGVMPYARIVVTPSEAQIQEIKEQGR